jgi:hypothetical protein
VFETFSVNVLHRRRLRDWWEKESTGRDSVAWKVLLMALKERIFVQK